VLLAVVIEMGTGNYELLISLVVAYVIILSIIGSGFAKYGDRIAKAIIGGINK
jgi:hypothetical protein